MVTRRPTADYIPVMVERIVEKFNPLRIILFGSHARGEAGPDSDIDLLVLFEGCADAGARSLEIRAALADVPAPKGRDRDHSAGDRTVGTPCWHGAKTGYARRRHPA